MAKPRLAAPARQPDHGKVVAVLGPTNTGKTHLAIERLCAHSSGAIGFPLRLLAREVYDRVCAIKGENRVALITGEERIEPKDARWLLCTAEAMPVDADLAFIALDEAQLCADRERGHVFTDRLLHARGRDETMLLGSATTEPVIRALIPEVEVVSRPRFSTLSHTGPRKLSRIPPRSAIVAFSAEQVYAVAEMLRRYRGGAAVVMGALSPQTRNAQVALYQSGEVDYLVATDAIGMGLNLDIDHVAFAGLSKFDGQRQRRLTTAEMAQIAGRAGRHQRDGTFGTLAGRQGHDVSFTDEEVYAIEEHRFPPLTRFYWRDAEPRMDGLAALIADLEAPPSRPELIAAPEAIDLAVLKALADDPEIAGSVRGRERIARFWDACRLPDFRQQGTETHARFVARLWQDLQHGYLGSDFMAARIAELDNPAGDIDTLQHRIASIRSWSYIAQRPDWVLAKEEMAARARAAEVRLSDALHARLTERFINRRTTVLMRKVTSDAGLLPVALDGDAVVVDGEMIGELRGLRFHIDADVRHADRKLLLAAAEKHLPRLISARAEELIAAITTDEAAVQLNGNALVWQDAPVARIERGRTVLDLRIKPERALDGLPPAERARILGELELWLSRRLAPLEPLNRLQRASEQLAAGPELRALLLRLVAAGGILTRERSGLEALGPERRRQLSALGVRVGTLDLFLPAMLKPAALRLWQEFRPGPARPLSEAAAAMPPVLSSVLPPAQREPVHGYRLAGRQQLRVDLAEKLLRAAHRHRVAHGRRPFALDPATAISMGLTEDSFIRLLRVAGFRPVEARALAPGMFGPPRPRLWRWQPSRHSQRHAPVRAAPAANPQGAFAQLADWGR